jgi:holo-[acyl-carrier protein] synthase
MVRISRVEAALTRFGDRFARRILTPTEFARFRRSRRQADLLAKHFAAKEALVKALGTGFRDGVSWRHIEVKHDPLGKPYLECSGRVLEKLEESGVAAAQVSLCDEDEYALAFVTLEKT